MEGGDWWCSAFLPRLPSVSFRLRPRAVPPPLLLSLPLEETDPCLSASLLVLLLFPFAVRRACRTLAFGALAWLPASAEPLGMLLLDDAPSTELLDVEL